MCFVSELVQCNRENSVEQRKKPQPTFCVSVKLWLHSDMHIWIHYSWTQRMLSIKSVGHMKLQ